MSSADNTLTGIPIASQSITDAILGPVVVGWMVQILLAGVAVSNFQNYANTPLWKEDTRRVKAMLWTVMGLLFLQTAIHFYSLYHYATWQHRDVDTLYAQTVIDCLSLSPVGILGAVVQGYLGTRATRLFKTAWAKSVYCAVLALGILGGLFGSVAYLAISFMSRAGTLTDDFPLNFNVVSGVFQWSCAFADCLVSATLCILLRQRLGNNRDTDSIMQRLLVLSIEAALYTSFFALMGAILAYALPETSVYSNTFTAFLLPLSSLYTISIIASLRGRARTRALVLDTATRMGHSPLSFGGSSFPGPKNSALELPIVRTPSFAPRIMVTTDQLAVSEKS